MDQILHRVTKLVGGASGIVPVVFIGMLPGIIGMAIYYFNARGTQSTIRDISLLRKTAKKIDDNEPLTASEYVERLQVASLKERADRIRRRYNRGRKLSRAVREHLEDLFRHGYVYEDVRGKVIEQLKEIDARNEQLKKQYSEIVLFAEKHYAEGVTQHVSEEAERAAQLLDEKNVELLNEVQLPDTMQEKHQPALPNPTVSQEAHPPAYSRSGIAESELAKLDPMIERLRALRCKSSESALYRKRLLALLPLIRKGADVDVTLPETKGNTALHFSCAIGSRSITQWLVEHGADVNAKTDRGVTPMDCLGEDNEESIRKLLQSRGGHYSK